MEPHFFKHTVKETHNFRFIENRANTTARAEKKLSVFIHRDIVVPVVSATILNPDKSIYDYDGKTQFHDKLFDTEIGNREEGCHYMARIVIRNNELVTAYTLRAFSPSFSTFYSP